MKLLTSLSRPLVADGARQSYSAYSVLLLAMAAGGVRLLSEWALSGGYSLFPLSDLTMACLYFWLAFFFLGGIIHVLTRRPWRMSIYSGAAISALLVLAPFLDASVSGPGIQYGNLWNFPDGYVWYLYNPDFHISLGESVAWWSVMILTSLYVGYQTRNPLKTLAALVLTYAVALLMLAGIPSLAEWVRYALDWPLHHRRTIFNLAQLGVALLLYAVLQPKLTRGLGRRIHHALPFVMFCMVGAAFTQAITTSTLVYAGMLLLVFSAALAQNDYFDAAEDSLQGRKPYLDLEDVRYLTISVGFMIIILAAVGTVTVVPLIVVLVTSMLYSYPFYRGKRYFPANLKMEGMWGLSSFTLGIVAALEHEAFGAPRWWLALLPDPLDERLRAPFDGVTLIAMLLVFGGYSFVAMLKDYKDWEADKATGIQTIYTLASRRGWSLQRVHGIVLVGSGISLATAPLLLAFAQRISWAYVHIGLVAAVLLWGFMNSAPSAARFKATLFLLTAYFLFLAVALSVPFPLNASNP